MSSVPFEISLRSIEVGRCFVVNGYEGCGVFMIIETNVLNQKVRGTVCLRPIPTSCYSSRNPFIGAAGETRWSLEIIEDELRSDAYEPIMVGTGRVEESLAYHDG